MSYCPECKYEFVEDIKECPDCKSLLVEALPDENQPIEVKWAPLQTLPSAMYAEMAKEADHFNIEDVAHDICEKLINRHPHVFGDVTVKSSKEVLSNWEHIKKGEKGKESRKYLVDGIPDTLPALFRAEKIQRRVSRVAGHPL